MGTMVAESIAKALLDGHFACNFAGIPSALDEEEPIVLRQGAFERTARMADCERGTVTVTVLVVREVAAEAESVAEAAERWVRGIGWERFASCGRWRICGIDTTAPWGVGRDSSGRNVWRFDVACTVVRSL